MGKLIFSFMVSIVLLVISANSLTYGDDPVPYDIYVVDVNGIQRQINNLNASAYAENVTGIINLNFTIVGGTNFSGFVNNTSIDVEVLQSYVGNISSSVLQANISTLQNLTGTINSSDLQANISTLQNLTSNISSSGLQANISTLQNLTGTIYSSDLQNNTTALLQLVNNANDNATNNTVAIGNIENLNFISPNIPPLQLLITGNDDSSNKSGLYPCIGDTYLGGMVFYVDNPITYGTGHCGSSGLISSVSYGVGKVWDWHTVTGNNFTAVGALASGIGGGLYNTELIVAALGVNQSSPGDTSYAAQYCGTLNISNYTDWYLPSIEELILLGESGGYDGRSYWSSTECFVNCTCFSEPDCTNVGMTYYNNASTGPLFFGVNKSDNIDGWGNSLGVVCIKRFD